MKERKVRFENTKAVAVRIQKSVPWRRIRIAVERLLAVIMVSLLLATTAGCEKINEIINSNKEPQSVAEGLPGVWEIVSIHYLPGTYSVYESASGKWEIFHREDYIYHVGKDSPDYFIVKMTDSTMTLLSGGKNLGMALMREYPYRLEQDSIISGGILRSNYENSNWTVKEMKRTSFKLVCSESGRFYHDGQPTDTVADGLDRVISMRRLK